MTRTEDWPHDPYTWMEKHTPFIFDREKSGNVNAVLFREPWYSLLTNAEKISGSADTLVENLQDVNLDRFPVDLPSDATVSEATGSIYALAVITRIVIAVAQWVDLMQVEVRRFRLHRGWFASDSLSIATVAGEPVLYNEY